MYDDIIHLNISKKFINNFNEFTHYYKEGGGLCGYSISPCSENKDQNLRFKLSLDIEFIILINLKYLRMVFI